VQESENSRAKAASMKMFGKLTRDTVEWHPDKLLCKRFNIANPYPEYVAQFSPMYCYSGLLLMCLTKVTTLVSNQGNHLGI